MSRNLDIRSSSHRLADERLRMSSILAKTVFPRLEKARSSWSRLAAGPFVSRIYAAEEKRRAEKLSGGV